MDAQAAGQGSIGKAALMGGIITAIVASTPYLDKVNSCCCVLVVAGGLFAAWILQSDAGGMAGTGRCGAAGLLSGFIGGGLGVPLGALVSRLAFGLAGLEERAAERLAQARQAMEGAGPLPPGFEPLMESMLRASLGLDLGPKTVMIALAEGVVFAFFGLLGGLVGGMLMGNRTGPKDPLAGFPPEPPSAPGAVDPHAPPVLPPPPPPGQASLPWDPLAGPEPRASEPDQGRVGEGSPPLDEIAPDADRPERGPLPPDELPRLPPPPPEESEDPSRS